MGDLIATSYSKAGVNIDTENQTIGIMLGTLQETFRNREKKEGAVMPSRGHFANYVKIGDKFFVLCCDGVGSKVIVAQMMEKYDTVGIDMIAMNVNDMICVGAEPIAMVDYLALENHDERMIREISKGMVRGAYEAGIAIIGGETATLREIIKGFNGRGFDLAGSCLGIVDDGKAITGEKAAAGDLIVGFPSSGLHSNGYTLARKVLLEKKGVNDILYGNATIGEELLAPTKIYVRPVLELLSKHHGSVHAMYNITGSGFMKFNRLKKGIGFRISRLLPIPRIFAKIQEIGMISDYEMFRTFNMGLGFAIITPSPENAIGIARKYDIPAQVIGMVDNTGIINIEEKKVEYRIQDG